MLAAMVRNLCCLVSCVAFTSLVAAAEPLDLLADKDLSAWEIVAAPAAQLTEVCRRNADGSLAIAGKPLGYVATKKSYDNFRLTAEWRWPADAAKNSNGGFLIHIASGPKDRVWPVCLQVQTKPSRVGDVLPMAGAHFAEKLSTPPDAKTPILERRGSSVEKPLGEWNFCEIVCHDGAMSVKVNGVLQNEVSDVTPGAGKIGFQLEGTPFELRSIRLEPR